MKHIYNPTKVAYTQRLSTKVSGTAAVSKIFSLLLLSFFFLVSGESVGQQVPAISEIIPRRVVFGHDVTLTINGTNFKDNNGNPLSIRIGNSTDYIKPVEVENNYIRIVIPSNRLLLGSMDISVRKVTGNKDSFSNLFTIEGVILTAESGQRCDRGSVTLTASGGEPGGYRWYRNDNSFVEGQRNGTLTTGNLTSDRVYYVSRIVSGYETNRIPVWARIGSVKPVVIDGYSCAGGSIEMMASGAPTNATYHWYDSNLNGAIEVAQGNTFSTTVAVGQTKEFYVTIKAPGGGCESEKVKVTATGGKLQTPSISSNLDCNSKGKEVITFYASGAGEGEKYVWYRGNTPLSNTGPTLIVETAGNPVIYYVSIAKEDNSCESDKRDFEVPSNGNKLPAAPNAYTVEGCLGNPVTLSPVVRPGMVYRWYHDGAIVDGLTYTFTPTSATSTIQFSTVNIATRCESSTTAAATVNALPQLISNNIDGYAVVCRGATGVTYSVPNVAGAVYAWTVTPEVGFTATPIINGAATNQITINYPSTDYRATIKVTVSNSCSNYTEELAVRATNNNIATGEIIEPPVLALDEPAVFKFTTNIPSEEEEIERVQWFVRRVGSTNWETGAITRDWEIGKMEGNIDGFRVAVRVKDPSKFCFSSLASSTGNLGINGFEANSFYIDDLPITPLPVELMFFKAQAQTQGVSLTWATASELENKGFEVQVSNNGREFKEIGFVESKVGTTSLRQDYNFLDTKAVSGTRYYRLKQMDFDGTTSYSPIRAVALDAGNGTVSVYPNPFDDAVIVTLNGTEARNVQVVLMDAMGKVLQQRTEETSGNSITVDMRSVRTKGIYILHVLDNDTKYTFKLMKR
ncbi:T9SS type A sorting domain-containing protein [Pontibacter sp. HSC-14F20]|uniref:Ig-like domain-containing protein n=1 Tax=Pontibacter sp. HSC-14F20 TaxID=2864136 RepID=UPI001C7384AB|nr:T9SS type A sorting domain-containing protein [Pontibacter sp. HSC-14F20]MBX0333648.1 T9SS type A sorting domain-containing protein [Pontibacter sp. HSC-14F20]